jgi:3',5'-cyclic AMP phosphodiesterase CpdA
VTASGLPRPFRFAVLADTHIGGTVDGHWHNRTLKSQATAIAGIALRQVVDQDVDLIVIVGDVTQNGSAEALAQAQALLAQVPVPLLLVTGNHDTYPESRAALLATAFPDQFPEGQGLKTVRRAGLRFIALDAWWAYGDGPQTPHLDRSRKLAGMAVPPEQLADLVAVLRQSPTEPTILLTHFPLLPMSERLRAPDRKDAGRLLNAAAVLDLIRTNGRVIASFSGHQHFNQIEILGGIVHCITTAMVEYPMMYRIVDVFDGCLRISTHQLRGTDFPARSLDGAGWVVGGPCDQGGEYVFSKTISEGGE